ncbi:MAG: energy transducer TonB [Opitutales bacterium]
MTTQRPPVTRFQEPNFAKFRAGAALLGIVVAGLVALMLPFTQWLSNLEPADKVVRSMNIAIPPPPPPPPEPPPPEEEKVEEAKPEMKQQLQKLSLSQMDISLNPGMGNALAGAFDVGSFGVQPNAAEEISIFELSELDRAPAAIRPPRPQKPFAMQQANINGRVELIVIINTEGRVRVLSVKNATHDEFVKPAIDAAEASRWETPRKDGKPVSTKFILPLRF